MNDLTVVYYTADYISSKFMQNTHSHLLSVLGGIPLVEIIKPPEVERSHFQIYRQALEGAKQAQTNILHSVRTICCTHLSILSTAHEKHHLLTTSHIGVSTLGESRCSTTKVGRTWVG